jgi:hypothetical protein
MASHPIKIERRQTMNERLPNPRALTRDELKLLRSAGLDPALCENEVTIRLNAEMVDWILDNVYRGMDFADIPYPDCLELATKSYQLTYSVSPGEAKNF